MFSFFNKYVFPNTNVKLQQRYAGFFCVFSEESLKNVIGAVGYKTLKIKKPVNQLETLHFLRLLNNLKFLVSILKPKSKNL